MDNKPEINFKVPETPNWETANKELSSAFQGSLNSWTTPNNPIESFANIPAKENNEQTQNQVSNNFNVNVNVNGSAAPAQVSSIQTEAQRIVNNVLNVTNPSSSPDDIKKNYNIPFGASLEGTSTSNLADYGFKPVVPSLNVSALSSNSGTSPRSNETPSDKTDRTSTITPKQNEVNQNLQNFKNKAFDSIEPINIIHSYMNAEEGDAYLPGLNNKNLTFGAPAMNHYTYSIASIKSENSNVKKNYDFIKNIIHKSLGEVSSDEMKQADKNERFVTEQQNYNRFISQQNLYFESGDTNIGQIEQITRELHQNNRRTENEANKTMIEVGRNIGRRKTEDEQLSDEINEEINSEDEMIDFDTPTANIEKINNLEFKHINDFENLMMVTELEEINRPPVWRSVLG